MIPKRIKVEELNRKHPEWEDHESDIRLIDIMTRGGSALRANLDDVLHSRPMEPSEMKDYRKKLFNYNNVLGTVNGWYLAKLFEVTPSIDQPEGSANADLQAFLEDSDRSGTPFVDKVREIADTLLRFRRVFILADQPQNETAYATREEEIRARATVPYLVCYDPRHVINWGRDGYGALRWIVARTFNTTQADEFPHAPVQESHWWYFSQDRIAHYKAVHENGTEPEWADLVSEVVVDSFRIVEIELHEDHWLSYRALLPAIKLLNLENALDWQLFINALAILTIKGRIDEKVTINELGYIHLPEGSDASYLEQSGTMANILRERCQELLENCYRLMYVIQQGRSGNATAAAQSGISKEMDTMPSLHVCSAIGDSLRLGMRRILALVADIVSAGAPEVRGFSFQTEDVAGSLSTLEKLNGLEIPSDTLYQEMEVSAAKEVLGDQPQRILDTVEREIRSGPTRSARAEAEKQAQIERFAGGFREAAA